jgi:exodeoxyribonuclease VII large subunit
MGRETKSQWEFGELFSQPLGRQVLTVSQLTSKLRVLLEKQLGQVWVSGEITNFKTQSSGHIYFTLKDANAQLSCLLFRGELLPSRQLLADGQKVVLQGALTVYEPRGQYQLRVLAVELQGIGALQQKFERLKVKLQAEGLFATERKRPIPPYPQCIGLVTSESGAAIRDVLHVIQRRNPALQIILAPCRVQGAGAAEEIACAINLLNECARESSRRIDVILVTRGGGSLEDLWAFNEEIVARAIFHSRVPVVSAVGHEIDFTISDFVADFRAATPTGAAEVLTEGAFASRRTVAETSEYLATLIRRHMAQRKLALHNVRHRLERLHPRRQLNDKLQYLDDLRTNLIRCARQALRHSRVHWQNLQFRFLRFRPALVVAERKRKIVELHDRAIEAARHECDRRRHDLDHLESRLRLLSPENVLVRGYSITMDAASGRIIRSKDEVRAGQKLRTKLASGEISSEAEK